MAIVPHGHFIDCYPTENPLAARASSNAPYSVYNIGNNRPTPFIHLVWLLERHLGKEAEIRLLPMQPGDVPATHADADDLAHDVGFRPATAIETGIARFVEWYREYYSTLSTEPQILQPALSGRA